jgi:hypothetical protein
MKIRTEASYFFNYDLNEHRNVDLRETETG